MDAPDETTFGVREAKTVEKAGRRRRIKEELPGDTFQVREAQTIRTAGGDVCATEDGGPGEVFQVREAATQALDPPHWAELKKPEEAPEMEMSPAAPVEDKEE